jgi:hypothetical protein
MPWLMWLQKHPVNYGAGGTLDVLAAPKLLVLSALNSQTLSRDH